MTITAQLIELEISRHIDLKARLEEKKTLAIQLGEGEVFEEILKECDFLIAGLYTLINPKKNFGDFNRQIKDKEFVLYAGEFASNLEKDLKGDNYV